MQVQLIGGPYDGRLAVVGAHTDEETGEPVPDSLVYSCPDPTVPDALRATPGAESVLGEDAGRRLSYDRERRGGHWVYVLHGDADPVLEALLRHIREQWPNRMYFSVGEPVPRFAREQYGQDFEDHLRASLMRKLHEDAAKQDLMILGVDGPAWTPRHPRTGPAMYGEPDDVFEVRAVGLPRYHPPTRSPS